MVGGKTKGDPHTVLTGIATIEDAGPGDLTFLANPKYTPFIEKTTASVIICSAETEASGKTLLLVDDPYLVYAKLVGLFSPPKKERGLVDKRAVLGTDVRLGSNATLYPFVFVGDNSVIDEETVAGLG